MADQNAAIIPLEPAARHNLPLTPAEQTRPKRPARKAIRWFGKKGSLSKKLMLDGNSLAAQHAVQIECRADQREVRESLRKVAQRFALRPGLFRVKSEMIRISQHPFKQ